MILLAELPEDHPLRNTPLGDINAEYRWKQAPASRSWDSVHDLSKAMMAATYNQLGSAWLYDDWRVNNETR